MNHGRAFHPLDLRAVRTRLILAVAVGLIAWFGAPWRPRRRYRSARR
jgi:hypothetical protein